VNPACQTAQMSDRIGRVLRRTPEAGCQGGGIPPDSPNLNHARYPRSKLVLRTTASRRRFPTNGAAPVAEVAVLVRHPA
jgi:hypothetical protein